MKNKYIYLLLFWGLMACNRPAKITLNDLSGKTFEGVELMGDRLKPDDAKAMPAEEKNEVRNTRTLEFLNTWEVKVTKKGEENYTFVGRYYLICPYGERQSVLILDKDCGEYDVISVGSPTELGTFLKLKKE